jgi:hypothetical protein
MEHSGIRNRAPVRSATYSGVRLMVLIDLRRDATDIQSMLADAVKRYATKHLSARTAKNHPPVTRIDLVFSLGDSQSTPWVHLHFDTEPGSKPDGSPTHPDFGKLPRELWLPAVQAVSKGAMASVVTHDGKSKRCDDAALTEVIGTLLVALLLKSRDDGLFSNLPKGDRCELGVEDPTTGAFGWPTYEQRGRENLVRGAGSLRNHAVNESVSSQPKRSRRTER